ncbi:MAG TPA: gluconate 2-dehydrogenase subunit 3 family protein, partial [Opitutus sp.]|nr:gluconate 2-dehydrogenase subunit 3 family protein [Opitutus sp.]
MDTPELPRIDRRTAIKWMLTAAASSLLAPHLALSAEVSRAFVGGYGTDPDLLKTYQPGDFWPLTFTRAQRRIVMELCDLVIPADAKSPSASAVGVHDFIDEWISAPYPAQAQDRKLVLEGIEWIEAESQKRFGQAFVNTIRRQKTA